MKIKIQNTVKLKNLLSDFVKNKKVLVNFECDGKVLNIQILNEYTICDSIEVISLDDDYHKIDLSFYLTKVINVLTEDEITMTLSKEALYIEQGTFSGIFIKEYEARREFPNPNVDTLTEFSTSRIKALITKSLALGGIFKELKVFEPDPVIVGNVFYMNATANSNIVFMDDFTFPTCCIPMKSLRECIYTFKTHYQYQYFEELNTLYFKSGEYEYWVPTMNYNIEGQTISEINKIKDICVPLTEIDLFPYVDRLKIVADAFPNRRIQLLIGKNSFQVQVNLNDATITVGDKFSKYLCSLSITTATLSAITKIYSDEGSVSVAKGVNCLLLQREGTRKVLLSALIN